MTWTWSQATKIGTAIAVAIGGFLAALKALKDFWPNAPVIAYVGLIIVALGVLPAGVGAMWIRHRLIHRRRNQLLFPTDAAAQVTKAVRDVLDQTSEHRAGLRFRRIDDWRFGVWVNQVLASAHECLKLVTPAMPDDANVVWLNADAEAVSIGFAHGHNTPAGFDGAHYRFDRGVALAGTVWDSGKAEVHDSVNKNPLWQIMPGCRNASYVCVCVGRAGGPGGVLGFGSDKGFVATQAQVEVLAVFASVLAIGAAAELAANGKAAAQ